MKQRTGIKLSIHNIYLPFFYLIFLSIVMISASAYLITNPTKSTKVYAISKDGITIKQKEIEKTIDVQLVPDSNIEISLQKPFKDYRAIQIDSFFSTINAPLAGYGGKFVTEADKHDIDWRLVASIANCESTGGKVTPQYGNKETFNAWGWAVYDNNSVTKKVSRYDMGSWEHGIEIVSDGMESYYKKGLKKPAEIVTRYTPASVRKGGGIPKNAPWTKCIQYTFDKIDSQTIELSNLNTNL